MYLSLLDVEGGHKDEMPPLCEKRSSVEKLISARLMQRSALTFLARAHSKASQREVPFATRYFSFRRSITPYSLSKSHSPSHGSTLVQPVTKTKTDRSVVDAAMRYGFG